MQCLQVSVSRPLTVSEYSVEEKSSRLLQNIESGVVTPNNKECVKILTINQF